MNNNYLDTWEFGLTGKDFGMSRRCSKDSLGNMTWLARLTTKINKE